MHRILIILILGAATSASAQRASRLPVFTRDSLHSGLRVRLFTPGLPFRYIGTLQGVYGDTLHFESERHHDVLLVPMSRITHLQVATEKKLTRTRLFTGAGTGLLVGFAVSRLVQITTTNRDGGTVCRFRYFDCIGPINVGITTAGAATGAFIVWKHPSDNWRTVTIR